MIWGLDTASRVTGWTAGVGDVRPETGAWAYDHVGSDLGALLDAFDADLEHLAERVAPTVIIYESPILTPYDGLLKLRKLYSMGAYLELWARRRGVVIEEEDLRTLKRTLAGTSKADKTEMVRMARKVGITLPPGKAAEDGADSFAAWLVGIHHHAREYQPRWDAALYGSRGALL